MPELPDDEQRSVRDAAEDYQSTVHAMLAFSAFVVHDATAQRPNSPTVCAYGSQLLEKDDRSVAFPNAKIVRKALDALVTMKLAMPLPTGTDEYRVLYRQFNDDILLRFASMLKTPAEKVMEQATLPFDEPQVAIPGSAAESQRRKRRASDQETRPAGPSKSRKKPPPK
ncbi:MAG TPA: hypothetical protein VLC46_10085 [Thermoanaerobaculia bacterium]|jgi:hypothetical protein|nr:hypothetical protein [Thermoanaerobaculia bacterium]